MNTSILLSVCGGILLSVMILESVKIVVRIVFDSVKIVVRILKHKREQIQTNI